MVAPLLVMDTREEWRPVDVEASLGRVGYTWEAGWRRLGSPVDRLDLPAVTPDQFADLAPVGYRRVVQGGRLYWHQYWFWYVYNPKNYPPQRGWGEHEGDWEMLQLGCKDAAGDEPVLMTCSQHDGGEKREFWRVTLEDDRPLVYVARESHAHYYEPVRDVTDQADGKGLTVSPAWAEFGAWASWSGQWGNSANSPGPLATRRAWRAPHAWHGQARG